MADNNSVEFTVRIKDEGLDKLAGNLGNVEQKVDALGSSSTTASQGVQKLDSAAGDAAGELNKLATAEDKAEQEAKGLGSGAGAAVAMWLPWALQPTRPRRAPVRWANPPRMRRRKPTPSPAC